MTKTPFQLVRVSDRPALPGAEARPMAQHEARYTKAEIKHERWRAGSIGWIGGVCFGFLVGWATVYTAFTWDGARTVETFSQGVAMGRATASEAP